MSRRVYFGLVSAVALVVGLLASWRLQLEPGTIGLIHDWSISPAPAQNVALAQQMFDGWYKWALGDPVTFPTEYPFRFALGALGLLGLGGAATTHAIVFLVPCAAFLCAWRLTYTWSKSDVGAVTAGVFYALNPVVLNKMVSGQTSYLVAYCMLPLVLWAYDRATPSAFSFFSAAFFGAVLALAGSQIQIGLVAVYLSIISTFVPRTTAPLRRRLAVLLTGCAVALAIQSPTIVGIFGGTPNYEDRAQFAETLAYLPVNSLAFADSLRLIGYLTRYDVIAISPWLVPWNAAMLFAITAALTGVISAPRSIKIFSAVSLVPCVVLMSGTSNSVLGPAILWLFTHFPYAQVFRELYHLMAVPALVYACGIAFFIHWVSRLRVGWIFVTLTALAIVMVSVPMLSGDASGWLRAFPIEQTYGDAIAQQNAGNTRVLWLPVDQPLSFHGQGQGTDPMGVTRRGSLWDYALNWPLTALDTEIRDGSENVETALRALSVGDVVIRDGMQSQLSRFTVNPKLTDLFFSSDVRLQLQRSVTYRSARGFKVRRPLPLLSRANAIALIPQRLDIYASALMHGYAPLAFSTWHFQHVPYALFRDSRDQEEEMLELGGVALRLPPTTVDARKGFASSSAWWWRRPGYADVPHATIVFGRNTTFVETNVPLRRARAVLAWIGSPVGGRIRVSAGSRSFTISTHGELQWQSTAFALGDIPAHSHILVSSLDVGSEIAVRSFTIIDGAAYNRQRALWRQALRHAAAVISSDPVQRTITVRSGTSRNLGYLPLGVHYRVRFESPYAGGALVDAQGFAIARFSSTGKNAAESVSDAVGTGSDAALAPAGIAARWKLDRVIDALPLIPEARLLNRSQPLVLWNWSYDDNWRSPGASSHLRSAIGTNVFVIPESVTTPEVFYDKTGAYHVAYYFGCSVFVFCLLEPFWTRCAKWLGARGGSEGPT